MKALTYFILSVFLILNIDLLKAQIENVIVEKYYISGTADTLDFIGAKLSEGSVTYRVYVDLEEGAKLTSLFSDTAHPLVFSSTANFFNHPMAEKSYGFLINDSWLSLLPGPCTYAFDSWLTIEYAANDYLGVLKTEDPDSSILTDGVGANNDPGAGISLTEKDGLLYDSNIFYYNINYNFLAGKTVFNKDTAGSYFESTYATITAGNNYSSPNTGNKILLAQITTAGELSFKLNVELTDSEGKNYRFVSADTMTGEITINEGAGIKKINVIYNNKLIYPPKTGCTDPYFDCYDPKAVIDDGSCSQCDSIAFGCLDPRACNFDATANFHLAELCCYGPDSCDNRDIDVVCPGYAIQAIESISVYPNPSSDNLNLAVVAGQKETEAGYTIYNAYGKPLQSGALKNIKNETTHNIDISGLQEGIYLISVTCSKKILTKTFIKIK